MAKPTVKEMDEVAEEVVGDVASMMQHELPPELREPLKPSAEDLFRVGMKPEDIMNLGVAAGFREYDAEEERERLEREARQFQSAQMIDAGPQVQKSHSRMAEYFAGRDCLRYESDAPEKGPLKHLKGKWSAGDPILDQYGQPQMCKRAPFVFSPRDQRPRSFGINGYIVHLPVNKPVNIPLEFIEIVRQVGYATEMYELVQNAMMARANMSIFEKLKMQEDPGAVVNSMPHYMPRS